MLAVVVLVVVVVADLFNVAEPRRAHRSAAHQACLRSKTGKTVRAYRKANAIFLTLPEP